MLAYHVSGWADLASAQCGTEFTLRPGTQCAEGLGVYFSETAPRVSAAEGCCNNPTAIIVIEVESSVGWWRTKPGIARKFGRPITWHTDGKSVTCKVEAVEGENPPVLRCTWSFTG